jgi:hypothetical protein
MKDFDPNEILRGLSPIELIELRQALADASRRAADRAALHAAITDFCVSFYGNLKKRPAARGFVEELLSYRRKNWPHDKVRGGVHHRAGDRRTKLFKIMRLCGGEPYRMRTIQDILSKSKRF